MPTRRMVELTVLATFPHLAARFPAGDLDRMPNAELAELWAMAKAMKTDAERGLARTLAAELAPILMTR